MQKWLGTRLIFVPLILFWVLSFVYVTPLVEDISIQLRNPGGVTDTIYGPCDFVGFWAVAQMATSGDAAEVYRNDKLFAVERRNIAAAGQTISWFYPPTGLLLPSLFATLPFFPAFLLWEVSLVFLSIVALRLAAMSWVLIIAAVFSPAALLNLAHGQYGLLTSSLFITSLLLAMRKANTTAVLVASLIFKPQIALLLPVVLLARGRYTALYRAGFVCLAVCLLTLILFGSGVWHHYASEGLPLSRGVLDAPFPSAASPASARYELYGASVFWMFRSFGWNLLASSAGQTLALLFSLATCWRIWRVDVVNPIARVAFTASLAMLATPYAYLYDMVGVSIAFAALANQERRLTVSDMILWIWPVIAPAIANHFFLELTPVILCFSAYRALSSLNQPPLIATQDAAASRTRQNAAPGLAPV